MVHILKCFIFLQRLALECHSLNADSQKYTPVPVEGTAPSLPDHPPEATQPYSKYLSTVHSHIMCAKEVHDALVECAKKVSDKGPLAMISPPACSQPLQQQPQQQPPTMGSMGPPPPPAPNVSLGQ